ncbi:hypothetical protein EB796_022193 [Bugula neritina]|uniref:Uncharacterized protein n=1 Tax=Bugula neritina TaxID=10212 RepID=A0A7J7J1E5_BUGNE|nr:hypothetical protein EB796_022193 [Bugula neritina]
MLYLSHHNIFIKKMVKDRLIWKKRMQAIYNQAKITAAENVQREHPKFSKNPRSVSPPLVNTRCLVICKVCSISRTGRTLTGCYSPKIKSSQSYNLPSAFGNSPSRYKLNAGGGTAGKAYTQHVYIRKSNNRIYTRGPAKSVQLDDSGENIVTGEDIIAGEEVLEFKSKRTYTQPKILPPPNISSKNLGSVQSKPNIYQPAMSSHVKSSRISLAPSLPSVSGKCQSITRFCGDQWVSYTLVTTCMFLLKFMILLNIQCLRLIILSSLIICVLGSNFVTRQSRKASNSKLV